MFTAALLPDRAGDTHRYSEADRADAEAARRALPC